MTPLHHRPPGTRPARTGRVTATGSSLRRLRERLVRPVAALTLVLALLAASTPAATAAPDAGTGYGRMMLVLDSSGSMKEPAGGGSTKIEAARQALGRVVDDLPADSDVGLRVFGATVFSRRDKGACTDSQQVVTPGTGNRTALRRAVAAYRPYGETPIAFALRQAARDLGGEGTRSIVLVSDGVATCRPDPCTVAADLAEQGVDLQIDVVGLSVDARARAQLRCIAAAGNGTYYDADSAEEIVTSLDRAATRAVRPFELEGRPLAGGTPAEPTPVEVGSWTDRIGLEGDAASRWFRFDRTLPGSTVQVGISSLGQASGWDAVTVRATSEEGTSCGSGSGLKQIVSGELLGVGLSAGGDDEGCSSGPLLIEVTRTLGGAEAPTRFSLRIVEEPPAGTTGLPGPIGAFDARVTLPPTSARRPPEVSGGSSFATATEISDGSYRGSIVPGEAQAFRIPVAFGQTLSARVTAPPSRGALEDLVGAQGPFASLTAFNPMRVKVPQGTAVTSTAFAAGLGVNRMEAGTTQVRYRNREDDNNTANQAGDYYLVYAADEDYRHRSFEMPFTLQVQVSGTESGVPTYADGAGVRTGATAGAQPSPGPTSPSADPSAGAAPTAEAAADRADGGSGRTVSEGPSWRLLAAGGLGLLAVAAVGAGVLVLRRSGQQ